MKASVSYHAGMSKQMTIRAREDDRAYKRSTREEPCHSQALFGEAVTGRVLDPFEDAVKSQSSQVLSQRSVKYHRQREPGLENGDVVAVSGLRSFAVNGCGSRPSHLRKTVSIVAASSRSQTFCAVFGSAEASRTSSRASNATPPCELAFEPLVPIEADLRFEREYEQNLMKSGPKSRCVALISGSGGHCPRGLRRLTAQYTETRASVPVSVVAGDAALWLWTLT